MTCVSSNHGWSKDCVPEQTQQQHACMKTILWPFQQALLLLISPYLWMPECNTPLTETVCSEPRAACHRVLLRYTGVHVNGMILQFTPGVIICDGDALFTSWSVKLPSVMYRVPFTSWQEVGCLGQPCATCLGIHWCTVVYFSYDLRTA
jgi:hypothetical protein